MTETDTSRERLERLQSIGCADYLHMALLARAEKAEAERDTAWNDAIEAAFAAAVEESARRLASSRLCIHALIDEIQDAIRALRK